MPVESLETNWKISLMAQMKDTVTHFTGIVTGRAEYSTGCKQYLLMPTVDDKGEIREGQWFDEDRLLPSVVGEPTGGPQRNPAPVK